MRRIFLLVVLLAVAAVLVEAAATTKRPVSRTRIRRPVSTSKTISKPTNSSIKPAAAAASGSSRKAPAVQLKKPAVAASSSSSNPPAPRKVAVPASSRRAASVTPDEAVRPEDPVARLAEDMERLEKIPDPTEWQEDEFNDLEVLPQSGPLMTNSVLNPDDPFADYEDLLFDDYELSSGKKNPSHHSSSHHPGRYLQSEV